MRAAELFMQVCFWLALAPIFVLLAVMVAEAARALGVRRRSLPECDYFPPPPPLRECSTRGQVKMMQGCGRRPARPPPPPAPPGKR